jgi:putative sterol carrier protein
MADVPGKDEMGKVLEKTVTLAGENLGADEVTRLTGVMKALCLELSDIEAKYYVLFDESGSAAFSTDDPAATPMLTIKTTTTVFHKMATGESNPAMEFALRKVKMSGVPMPKLAKVGPNLIDTLFQCYSESL